MNVSARTSLESFSRPRKNPCLEEVIINLNPKAEDFLDELLRHAKCDDILAKQKLFDVIMEISTNQPLERNLRQVYLGGKVISGNQKIKFNNLKQLQKIIMEKYHAHHENLEESNFVIVFNDTLRGGEKWSFDVSLKNGQQFVDFGDTFVGYTFDTCFLIDKKDSQHHQDYFGAIKKRNGGRGMMRKIDFQFLKKEYEGNYGKKVEKKLLEHFMRQVISLEIGHSEEIKIFLEYCLSFFSKFYSKIKEKKQKNNSGHYESIAQTLKTDLFNKFMINEEFLDKHNSFLRKIYYEININSKSNGKTPLLVDRLSITLNMIVNIFNYPSKSMFFTEDSDALSIAELFINCIIPQFLAQKIEDIKTRNIFNLVSSEVVSRLTTEQIEDEQLMIELANKVQELTMEERKRQVESTGLEYGNYIYDIRNFMITYSYMVGQLSSNDFKNHICSVIYPSLSKIVNIYIPGIFGRGLKGDAAALAELDVFSNTSAQMHNQYTNAKFSHINVVYVEQESLARLLSQKENSSNDKKKINDKRKQERQNKKKGRKKK